MGSTAAAATETTGSAVDTRRPSRTATAAGIPAEIARDGTGKSGAAGATACDGVSPYCARATATTAGEDWIASVARSTGETLAHGARGTGGTVRAATATGAARSRSPCLISTTRTAAERGEAEGKRVRARITRTWAGTVGLCAARADGHGIRRAGHVHAAGQETARAAAAAVTIDAGTTAADDEVFDRGIEVDAGRARQGDRVRKRGDRAADLQCGPADRQRTRTQRGIMVGADGAAGDRGTTGVSVRAGQRDDALAGRDRTGAADDTRDHDEVGTVEG